MRKKKRTNQKKKRTLSIGFASILAIVSIIGFLEIILSSFFNFTFGEYIDFLWLTVLGIGLILQSKPNKIHKKKKDETVTSITSLVIGALAVIAGILSLPFIGIIHPVFLATKGVISIIAVMFIILETWVISS